MKEDFVRLVASQSRNSHDWLARLEFYLAGCQLMVSTDNGNGGGDFGGGGGDGGGCQVSAAQPGLRLQREMWRGSSAP